MKKIVYIGLSLMLMFLGIFFSACDNGKKISLSLNDNDLSNGKIELYVGDDPKEITVTINNYTSKIDQTLHVDIPGGYAKKTDIKYLDGGVARVYLSAESVGSTTMRISTFDRYAYIDVPLVVKESLKSLTVKDGSLFYTVKGGDTYVKYASGNKAIFRFDDQIFNETTESGVNFYYSYSNGTEKELIVSDFGVTEDSMLEFVGQNGSKSYPVLDSIDIIAESKTDNTISTSFEIFVIDDINTNNVAIFKKDSNDEITQIPTFIRNHTDLSRQKFRLRIPENVDVELSSLYGNYTVNTEEIKNESGALYLPFTLQALATVPDELIVTLTKKDFSAHSTDLKYPLNSAEIPSGMLVNDVLSDLSLTLYNGRNEGTAQNLSLQLYPENSNNNNFEIETEVFVNYGLPDQTLVSADDLKDILGIKCGTKDLLSESLSADDSLENIKIWISQLTEGYEDLTIKFTCETVIDGQTYEVSSTVNISVKEGADTFSINRESGYQIDALTNQVVLYAEVGKKNLIFDDFVVTSKNQNVKPENIDISDMRFVADVESMNICSISQVYDDGYKAEINIYAKKVGTATYKIELASGATTTFKVCVVDLFDPEKDLSVYQTKSDRKNIAQLKYTPDGNIKSVVIKNSNYSDTNKSSEYVTFATSVNATPVAYEWQTPEFDNNNFDVVPNNNTQELKISGRDLIPDPKEITLKLNYKKVDGFKLVDAETYDYTLSVSYVATIESFEISANTNVVYPKDKVGYHGESKELHKAKIEIDIEPSSYFEDKIDKIKPNIKWSFSGSYMTNFITSTQVGSIYTIDEYGEFDSDELTFTYTGDDSQNLSPELYIYAEYEEYGTIHYSYLSLSLEDYITVNQISFKNVTAEIYLDPTHKEFSLYPVVYPENANDKTYAVIYEGENGSYIDIDILDDGERIKLQYTGSAGGDGILRIIPITAYTEENSYTYSRELKVKIADGSKDHPLKISTAEELLAINNSDSLTKHYEIYGEIDLGYKPFVPFGTFSGSITGNDEYSKISGINISNTFNNCAGLFTEIAEGATISNLQLEGKVTLQNITNTNVGVLCGINKGTITNVNLQYTNDSNKINLANSDDNGFGCLVGINEGTIQCLEKDNPKNTAFVEMSKVSPLEISGTGYIGGVAGINKGTIEFDRNGEEVVYNNYGISVYVNFNVSSSCGGVVGYNNDGTISGLLATGRIKTDSGVKSYSAGIAGASTKGSIESCTSRVFVRSNQVLAGLCARVAGTTIKYCNVEAIYDGTSSDVITNAQLVLDFNGTLITGNLNPLFIGTESADSTNNDYYSWNSNISNILACNQNNEYVKESGELYYKLPEGKYGDDPSKFRSEAVGTLKLEYENELLFVYKAKNKTENVFDNDGKEVLRDNQSLINDCNYHDSPFKIKAVDENDIFKNNLIFESKNPNVLSIGNNGQFIVHDSGKAVVVIKSLLNASQYVEGTVYVTPKVDGYALYVGSDKNSYPVSSGSKIVVFENKTVELYSKLTANPVKVEDKGIDIELIDPDSDFVKVILEPKTKDKNFININTLSQTHIISAGKDLGETKIDIEIQYENGSYTKYITEKVKNNFSVDGIFDLSAELQKGITAIDFSDNNKIVYPESTPNINAVIETNDDLSKFKIGESFTITLYDDNDRSKVFDTYYSEEDDYIYFIIDKDLPEIVLKLTYTKDGDTQVQYNFVAELLNKSYNTTFALVFESDSPLNPVTNTYYLTFNEQPISSIVVNAFSQKETAQKENVSIIEPGETNYYLEVFVDPYYSNYDYIDITNDEENYTNVNYVLFSAEYDYEYAFIPNGIRIFKPAEENAVVHKLKITMSSEAVNNSSMTLNINAYERLNSEPVYTTSRTLLVKQLAQVKVSIPNKTEEQIYVAQGVKYLLEVNTGKYTKDQVVVFVDKNDQARVVKQNDMYYLEVFNSAKPGTDFNIKSYGFSQVDGETVQSLTYSLPVTVVDVVVQGDKIQTDFDYFKTFVGAEEDFISKMLEGIKLEYNSSIVAVRESIKEFYKGIKDKATVTVEALNSQTGLYNQITLDIGGVSSYICEYFELYNKSGSWIFKSKKIIPNKDMYRFRIDFRYNYSGGKITCDRSGTLSSITKYAEVESNSSMENPFPIYTVEEFMAMKDGFHYILLSDLTLPSPSSTNPFSPIKAQVASFNGNNHKIYLNTYRLSEIKEEESAVGQIDYAGLFETVGEKAVIKNVNLVIKGTINISIEKASSSSTYVGLIAGKNSGSITNCKVLGEDGSRVNVNIIDIAESLTVNYVAGLVGQNEGYITNSNVEAYISSNTNLAGLVGINSGHISASYVKNAYIRNLSSGVNATNKTAGFVLENSGYIYTSYSAGTNNNYSFYADSTLSQVAGVQEASGFVFYNKKTIKDCYSDIPTYAQSTTAGFVCINTGDISNSFTTSKLKDNSQASFYFYATNQGKISKCYFAKDINTGIFEYPKLEDSVLKGLATQDFAESTLFDQYSIAQQDETNKRNYVWFYASNDMGRVQPDTEFNIKGEKYFVPNRPQLVSANIELTGRLELDSIIIDEKTNEERHIYKVSSGYPAEGTEFNPYIIANASDLERYVYNSAIRSTDRQLYTFSNFRVINNIVYGENNTSTNSSLYKVALCGEFDGNNLTISNYSINTNEVLTNAGFFAQVGGKIRGSVKSAVFSPKYLNCPNANIVGTVAGTVNNGAVMNVSVVSGQVVIGKNIAGGAIGRVVENSKIMDVSSDASVSVPTLTNNYDENILYSYLTNRISSVSYAGGIIGILSGENCSAQYLTVTKPITVIGKVIGTIAGGVVDGAKLSNTDVTISKDYNLKAYGYGGYLVGHNAGKIENCKVSPDGEIAESFNVKPIVAKAVGGICGIMQTGAIIDTCEMNADIISTKISTVGGAVGFVSLTELNPSSEDIDTKIKNITINGNVKGALSVGGLIGRVSHYNSSTKELLDKEEEGLKDKLSQLTLELITIENEYIEVNNKAIYTEDYDNYGIVGGLIGTTLTGDMDFHIGTINIKTSLKLNIYSLDKELNTIKYAIDYIFGYMVDSIPRPEVNTDNVNVSKSTPRTEFIKNNDIVDEDQIINLN